MTALTNTRAKEPLRVAMRRKWRELAERMSRSGLDSLDNEEVARIAKDASVSVSDLRALARRSPRSADLLLERMTAIDIDKAEVARLEPVVFRDLQRVCSTCRSHARCMHDLRSNPADPAWKDYCPNADTLVALDALPWAARSEW